MNYKLLGTRMREYRMRKHISQEKLAEVIDVSVPYIGALENARRHPSLDTIVKIANALDTTTDCLLNGNQRHDTIQYGQEIDQLLHDCDPYERRVIFLLLAGIKSALRDSRGLLDNKL